MVETLNIPGKLAGQIVEPFAGWIWPAGWTLGNADLGLGGKLTSQCCASSHIFRTEKAFQHIKLPHLCVHFTSGSLLFNC